VVVRSSPGAASNERSPSRERIIDAALDLFTRHGYDVTTAGQIATLAGVSPANFARYFATPEAVLLSIVDDMTRATAANLRGFPHGGDPERALLSASTAMVTAIADGRGAVPLERLFSLARIVNATRNLNRTISAERRRVIAPALADWMGVDQTDRRLQRALTMWSAVVASTYAGGGEEPDDYESQPEGWLQERIIANLSQSFGEVMGDDLSLPE
jgi:AcrR family transcriptional regulator